MLRHSSIAPSRSNTASYQYTSYDYDSTHSRSGKKRSTSTRPSTARPRTGVSTLGVEFERIVCAVTESRGISPTVGLAFINLDKAEGIMCQISDSQTYVRTIQKLEVYSPTQILIANTAVNPFSNLVRVIDEHGERLRTELVVLDRKYWSEKTGMEYLENLAFAEDLDSIKISVGDNYYAVCCFSAVLKHVELGLSLNIAPNSLPIRYEASEGSMMIDSATIKSLELIQNLNNSKSKHCLFGLLNKTHSSMGARLLRSNLLQPLTEPETLEQRYAALEELTTNEEMFFGIQNALKKFPDTDKVLSHLIVVPKNPTVKTTEQNVNNVLALKDFVTKIEPVLVSLAGARSHMLHTIQRLCGHPQIQQVKDLLNEAINEDTIYATKPVDLRNQRVYAVKLGFNGLLDVARGTYKESTEDAFNHVNELGSEHNLPLKFCFDQPRQHFIRLPVSELEDRPLPGVFINVFQNKKNIECQTLELKKYNAKIYDSHTEVLLMSDRVIRNLIAQLCEYTPRLFKISEGIAMLDVFIAFASLVTTRDYIRPRIGENLAVRGARHPIRESILDTKFVPNDVYATQTRRFQIVTGCNMSGKSTYIRSVALISVMGQIGCFVPAQQACLPVITQLLARVSTDDMVEANVSTFSAEMRETAYILNNVDKNSLVIIDELGRGTSSRDGLAISLAIAEALVDSRALVWFATHFRDLSRIMSERAGVTSMHLSVDTSREGSLSMSYQVSEGVEKAEHYGLLLAKVLPFPNDLINKAERVAMDLELRAQQYRKASPAIIHARRRRLILHLKEQLRQAHQGRMDDAVLSDWLRLLQKEFVMMMRKIDQEAEEARRLEQGVEDSEEVEDGNTEGTGEARESLSSAQSMLF
ncbi:hypothetical protein K461DRAFT_218151 [Myriangium duriaei CBS 260.36]|uniref:DNA mismatch repair protein MSH3 n=1 Tax=Myriangium duriaei CBS 260.36 TaxID=1168546 RepID=A0A9P4J865_9PEZI|nr:hypothetical protein K461DRAFT_218151 [Myriangium duriaei CBS 260.36]